MTKFFKAELQIFVIFFDISIILFKRKGPNMNTAQGLLTHAQFENPPSLTKCLVEFYLTEHEESKIDLP